MEQYKNKDGTYTSPRNGKTYKSLKAFIAHWNYAGHATSSAFADRLYDVNCIFCKTAINISNIKKHENSCFLNPANVKLCAVCNIIIKNYKSSKGTCSRRCANKHFRSGEDNGNWGGERYQTICFAHHEKKCVICGETNIVAVHHYDHNHENNDPANLVPLCPTHHNYMHSRFVELIKDKVDDYVRQFILRFA